jgi:hypothetical protein
MSSTMSAALETLLIKSANIRLMATVVIGRVSVPIGEYCSIVRVRAQLEQQSPAREQGCLSASLLIALCVRFFIRSLRV